MNISKIYSMINLYRIVQTWDLKENLAYLSENMTEAKVKRCAILGFGFLVALRTSPLAIGILTGSIYSAYFLIRDYEDLKEIEMMREGALSLDFLSIIKEHGSIAQVLDSKILTYKELKDKLKGALSLAKKSHSEHLPQLIQFEKQMKARKDPEENDSIAGFVKTRASFLKKLLFPSS